MQKEAKARIKINRFLEEAGWRFFDDENGRANIVLEPKVTITQKEIDALGNDFEQTKKGFVDFLLLDEQGYPLVVLEAKSEEKSPLDGKEQARRYAKSQNVRFIILSNGNLHYFWDLERGNPQVITAFPTIDSLETFHGYKPNPALLAQETIKDDYIVLTQNPTYIQDPRWTNEATRNSLIKEQNLSFLRPYQLKAMYALQDAAQKNADRYLFEMATGTGKTLVSAAVIKLFLKSGNAKRVLFLVDRIELEDQAHKNFIRYLKNDYTAVIYKEKRDEWRNAEIVVSTVQTLAFNNKYKKLFSPTDFDLIISDEAHRSIGGNSRAVFEYFIGYKLGLTATPKDYLKKIDSATLSQKDPREWERRQLLDTYQTFGCPSGVPTYRYSLIDGVREKYLVNPIVSDARTDITTTLLSEKGYSLLVENEEGIEEQQTFFTRDFERKFFSEETNRVFCKTFLEHALKDPITGEIGKTIVFCVSQSHASKITQVLNEFADLLYPGKYNSDFAVQVTSNIPDAQRFTTNFTNNNLNGHTNFLEGYKTSKTRVCVTVSMMTTGYDCQDILNLCLMRPIFSPTNFVQIKGRGTRKYTFSATSSRQEGQEDEPVEKTQFKLFDFFANCEYFEEKFNYDEVLQLPQLSSKSKKSDDTFSIPVSEVTLVAPDPLKVYTETAIGVEGMKVDRRLFEKFEETVKSNQFIRRKYDQGDIEAIEEYLKAEVLDKPTEYITLEKLRRAVKADRRISLREFIENIFAGVTQFKSKDELLEEEYEKFVSIYKPDSDHAIGIKNFLKAYITDTKVREIIDKKQYGRLDADTATMTIQDLRALNGWRDVIPNYVKDYVSLNTFM
jgi:type I restriction enzyme, R subunit